MAKKKYVSTIENFGLDFINKLKPAKWRYEAPLNDGRDHFGFIAQDVMEIVSKEDFNFVTMREDYFSINYWEFMGPMCKAIQELSTEVKDLKKRLYEKQKIQTTNGEDQKIDERKIYSWWNPKRYFS